MNNCCKKGIEKGFKKRELNLYDEKIFYTCKECGNITVMTHIEEEKTEIPEIEYCFASPPEEVTEEVKMACEKESERLLRIAEEKRRANR
jgi:hypothetical protein